MAVETVKSWVVTRACIVVKMLESKPASRLISRSLPPAFRKVPHRDCVPTQSRSRSKLKDQSTRIDSAEESECPCFIEATLEYSHAPGAQVTACARSLLPHHYFWGGAGHTYNNLPKGVESEFLRTRSFEMCSHIRGICLI